MEGMCAAVAFIGKQPIKKAKKEKRAIRLKM